eukprot:CAMPEP_0118648288 /NCGR_PEP_ID=MMETSP0785-20121206/9075_1 /TAXON_ID=91992 /ORGANISM="Bolidomonas pacifica, Strain CCMP 1866" /LENGTH=158 /DNA_ID=CAMNT_0006540469 /DNA_START=420 /DNA_END=893 /DNA_ORIENTATION=-
MSSFTNTFSSSPMTPTLSSQSISQPSTPIDVANGNGLANGLPNESGGVMGGGITIGSTMKQYEALNETLLGEIKEKDQEIQRLKDRIQYLEDNAGDAPSSPLTPSSVIPPLPPEKAAKKGVITNMKSTMKNFMSNSSTSTSQSKSVPSTSPHTLSTSP